MDLNYTPEDIAYRKQVRTWLEQNMPKTEIRTLEDRRAWHRKLYEAGYLGMGWPKEYGGGGARPMEQAIVADELARANAPAPTNSLGIGIVGPTIVVHGTDAQKERWLRPLVAGEIRSCFTMTEPEFAGSNPVWMGTTAKRDGDHWVIRGHKWFASSADGAALAVCMAVTDADAEAIGALVEPPARA